MPVVAYYVHNRSLHPALQRKTPSNKNPYYQTKIITFRFKSLSVSVQEEKLCFICCFNVSPVAIKPVHPYDRLYSPGS